MAEFGPVGTGNNYQYRGCNVSAIGDKPAHQVASNYTLPDPPRGSNIRVYEIGLRIGGALGENGRAAGAIWDSSGNLLTNSSAKTVGGTQPANKLDYEYFNVTNTTLTKGQSILIGFWRNDANCSYTTSWSFDTNQSGTSIWYDNSASSVGKFDKDLKAYSTATICHRIKYYYDPAKATSVTKTMGVGSASITWTAPSDWGDSDLKHYYVQYCTDDASWDSETTTTTSKSKSITGLTANTTYYFRVISVANSGLLSISSTVSGKTPSVPDAPVLTATVKSSSAIDLSWTTPKNNGSELDAYVLQVSTTSDTAGFSNLFSDNVLPLATTYSHTGLPKYTNHWYRVLASNGVGSSAYSKVINARTSATVPGGPTGLTATPDVFSVALSWTAPSDTGGIGLDLANDYVVKRGTTTLGFTGGGTTFTDTGLSPATEYTYTVAAVNSIGAGTAVSVSTTTLGGIMRIWNGNDWVTWTALPKVWNGSAWVVGKARVYTGVGATEDDKWKYGI